MRVHVQHVYHRAGCVGVLCFVSRACVLMSKVVGVNLCYAFLSMILFFSTLGINARRCVRCGCIDCPGGFISYAVGWFESVSALSGMSAYACVNMCMRILDVRVCYMCMLNAYVHVICACACYMCVCM